MSRTAGPCLANDTLRISLVWVLLALATCASTWWLSSGGGAVALASAAIVLIAGVKVRLIMLHFMELARAPWAWRFVFEAWVVAIVAAILALYLRQGGSGAAL